MPSDTIALEKSNEKDHQKATKRIKKQLKSGKITISETRKAKRLKAEKDRGLIYLGHLPHGFYEEEIKKYFSQFGLVTNAMICRSKKTGNSKGYAYVEFKHKEVAKIAAETMNNYVMFKKRVTAEYVPEEKRPRHIFHGKRSVPGRVAVALKRERQRRVSNKPMDEETHKKKCEEATKKLAAKMKKLADRGIKYDLRPVNVPASVKSKAKMKKDVQQ